MLQEPQNYPIVHVPGALSVTSGCGQLDARIREQKVSRHNLQTGNGRLMHRERIVLRSRHVESLLDRDLFVAG